MTNGRCIDHVVLGVEDRDTGAHALPELGFTLTPRGGRHIGAARPAPSVNLACGKFIHWVGSETGS